MWTCVLCGNKEEWTRSLCNKCDNVKKIVDIYGIDKIAESLRYIYVRVEEPIKNREKQVKARQ